MNIIFLSLLNLYLIIIAMAFSVVSLPLFHIVFIRRRS